MLYYKEMCWTAWKYKFAKLSKNNLESKKSQDTIQIISSMAILLPVQMAIIFLKHC